MEISSVKLRPETECRKMRLRKTSKTDTFEAVYEFILFFFKIASAKLVQETLSAKGQNLKIRLVTITIDTNAFLKFEDGCE